MHVYENIIKTRNTKKEKIKQVNKRFLNKLTCT